MKRVLGIVALLSGLALVLPGHSSASDLEVGGPASGACLKGGTSQQVTWSGASYDHGKLSYTVAGGASTEIIHPLNGLTYSWTIPSITSDSVRLVGEGHDGSHQVLASGASALFAIDSSLPTAPQLSLVEKTTNSAKLSWTASSDPGCKGLVGYRLYKNGSLLMTFASPSTVNYTDGPLTPGSSAAYAVEAYDDFGSTKGAALTVSMDVAATPTPAITTPTPVPNNPRAGLSTGTPAPGLTVPAGQEDCYKKVLEAARLQDLVAGKSTMTQAERTAVTGCSPKTVFTPQQLLLDCLKQAVGTDFLDIAEGRKQPTKEQQALTTPCFTIYFQSSKKVALPEPAQVRLVKTDPGVVKVGTVKQEGKDLVVVGNGPANSTVVVYIFSDPVTVEAKTDASGNWKLAYGAALPEGTHHVYALANADAGLARSTETEFKKDGSTVTATATPAPHSQVESTASTKSVATTSVATDATDTSKKKMAGELIVLVVVLAAAVGALAYRRKGGTKR